MSLEENKAIIRRYVEELWNAGKYDAADEIVHPKACDRSGNPLQPNGPEWMKQSIQQYRKDAPDIHRTILDMVAEGDKVVLYSTFTATHTEAGSSGFAPTGERLETTGVATWRIEDGKIIQEPWSCWNHPARFQQVAQATMGQFIEKVWNEGDLAAADQYVASDYVRHDPAAPENVAGLDGFKETVTIYRTAFPDLHLEVEEIIAAGKKGETVSIRWSGAGTHRGALMGVAPTGKQVNSSGITFLRLEKGKIVEEWVQWDNLGLLQQLGAMSV